MAGPSGRLGCFDFPTAPPRGLVAWYIDHPAALTWVESDELTREATRLRRALIEDAPPGAREKAQQRARELLGVRSPFAREWWRFEDATRLECALLTDRLVITVAARGDEAARPASPWYPARSELVRVVEAARELAGDRAWASLSLSESRTPSATRERLRAGLTHGAPHLDSAERAELAEAYLGQLTWAQARRAVGLD